MAEPKSFPALLFLVEHEESLPRFDSRVAKDARAELEKATELLALSTEMRERSGYGEPSLAVLEARIGEVKSTRYVAARSANTGDVVLDCDKRIAQLVADLQRQKAEQEDQIASSVHTASTPPSK
jgi:hypothetical protein